MKRLFTLVAIAMCCAFGYAQNIAFQLADGKLLENGTITTVEGYLDESGMFELYSGISLKNLTANPTDVVVTMKAVSGESQICVWGTCKKIQEGQTEERGGTLDSDALVNLEIGADIFMDPTALYTRTVEVSAWTVANPDAKITATVTYTNDPAVLGVESVTSDARIYVKDNVFYYSFSNDGERELQLFDIVGQPCKSVRLESEQGSFSVEGMNKGLYLYRVTERGERLHSGKIFVK